MSTPTPVTEWDDSLLISSIMDLEYHIRTAQQRLNTLNAEWTRRHESGPCSPDCREPMAGVTFTTRRFDRFDLTTYAGRRFAFKEHGESSYFGRGPWVLAEGETGRSENGGSCAVRFVPAPGATTYSPSVTVWPAEVPEFFEVLDPQEANA